MTERAEIERLLQKTGRTLEGLPLDYETRFYTERIEPHRDGGGFANEYSMAYEILHQSDVIELLIGALRDSEPVVRCKDCVHRHESEFCECRDDDAFCSDGERQTSERV